MQGSHKVTEKQMANLRPMKKGDPARSPGRPPKLANKIKTLPKDIQEKVYGILAYALTLEDETAARKFLECKEGELGRYGFVLQIAIKQLTKEGWGFGALMDILDRLFGKPRQSAEVTHTGGIYLNIITNQETKELIEGGLG